MVCLHLNRKLAEFVPLEFQAHTVEVAQVAGSMLGK